MEIGNVIVFRTLERQVQADKPGNMKNVKTFGAPLLRKFFSIVYGNVCDIFPKFLVQEFDSSRPRGTNFPSWQ